VDYGLPSEDLRLAAEDGVRLHGWWIGGLGRPEDRRFAVLYFHGNAGNVSHRLDRSKRLAERFGVDVLLLDYRGYGRSEGRPSEAGLYRDARAAWAEAVRRGFPPERIILFGESLGCAVAVQLATEKPAAGLVLETPFLSVPALARKFYPVVPGFLIRTRFDSEKKIARIAAPKLFIQAENDEIVPAAHARRLHALAPPPKDLYRIPGAGHNDTYVVGGEDYLRAWERFLRSISPGDGHQ
jgi:pimeloyl-ACP methyl ester carboxylesterase